MPKRSRLFNIFGYQWGQRRNGNGLAATPPPSSLSSVYQTHPGTSFSPGSLLRRSEQQVRGEAQPRLRRARVEHVPHKCDETLPGSLIQSFRPSRIRSAGIEHLQEPECWRVRKAYVMCACSVSGLVCIGRFPKQVHLSEELA